MTLAFMDLGHVNPGHTIVAVKRHIENIYGLDETLAAAVFRTATRIAKVLKKAMQPEGITLLQANETAGWQTVFHFHFHVLLGIRTMGRRSRGPRSAHPGRNWSAMPHKSELCLKVTKLTRKPARDEERLAGERSFELPDYQRGSAGEPVR